MSLCHILPPHREHRFRGATGCSKEISHDGPHSAILKDGTAIEWENDWECECCVDDENPDMCFVWKEIPCEEENRMSGKGDDPHDILGYAQECRELVEWWDTGILPDGRLRARANDPQAKWAETNPGDPHMAERQLVNEIIRKIASIKVEETQDEGAPSNG